MSKVVIAGVPRSGKTSLSEKFGGNVMSTDSLIDTHDWSDMSTVVADDWLGKPDYIIEGVAAVRGLRKWLNSHEHGKPCDVVYWSSDPKVQQTEKQAAMGKGAERIFDEIADELVERGVDIKYF